MAERPIIFSGPMVNAILAGRKSQTRRMITEARVFATPERKAWTLRGADLERALQNADRFRRVDGNGWFWESDAFEWQAPAIRTGWLAHIGFAPGDVLWVREAWRTESRAYDDLAPSDMDADYPIIYEADAEWKHNKSVGRLRASMHMPRWASRLTLTVTDVRVQRLHAMSLADAYAEGIPEPPEVRLPVTPAAKKLLTEMGLYPACDPFAVYQSLWETLHGPGSWDANPWVTAITFTAERRNIYGGPDGRA